MWTIIDTYLQLIHKIYTVKNIEKPTFSDTYPHYPQTLLLKLLLNNILTIKKTDQIDPTPKLNLNVLMYVLMKQ